jgi:hypothetical protein
MTDTITAPAITAGARARLTRGATDQPEYPAGFEFIVDEGPFPLNQDDPTPHYGGHSIGDDPVELWFPVTDVEPVENHTPIPEGTRVRFIRDVAGRPGDPSRTKGYEFEIGDGPYPDDETGLLFYYGHSNGGYNNVDAHASDIEVSASLEDIAKEPKEFTITSTVTIEYEHVVKAHSRAEAVAELMAGDITEDWSSKGKPEVKIEPQDIAEKGYDY